DPALPDHKRQAGQHQVLGEIAPGDVMVIRPVDGKILPPGWLLGQRPAIGTRGHLVVIGRAHYSSSSNSEAASRSSGILPAAAGSCTAAVTSRSAGMACRGAIMCTFVAIVCRPKRKRLNGVDCGRWCSISLRLPKNSAPLGQTVAHIGRLPAE